MGNQPRYLHHLLDDFIFDLDGRVKLNDTRYYMIDMIVGQVTSFVWYHSTLPASYETRRYSPYMYMRWQINSNIRRETRFSLCVVSYCHQRWISFMPSIYATELSKVVTTVHTLIFLSPLLCFKQVTPTFSYWLLSFCH